MHLAQLNCSYYLHYPTAAAATETVADCWADSGVGQPTGCRAAEAAAAVPPPEADPAVADHCRPTGPLPHLPPHSADLQTGLPGPGTGCCSYSTILLVRCTWPASAGCRAGKGRGVRWAAKGLAWTRSQDAAAAGWRAAEGACTCWGAAPLPPGTLPAPGCCSSRPALLRGPRCPEVCPLAGPPGAGSRRVAGAGSRAGSLGRGPGCPGVLDRLPGPPDPLGLVRCRLLDCNPFQHREHRTAPEGTWADWADNFRRRARVLPDTADCTGPDTASIRLDFGNLLAYLGLIGMEAFGCYSPEGSRSCSHPSNHCLDLLLVLEMSLGNLMNLYLVKVQDWPWSPFSW